MNIRIEANSLTNKHISGVGYFTKRLAESLVKQPNTHVSAFSFNFLNRQQKPLLDTSIHQDVISTFPLRVYAKLQSHRLALYFDALLKPVDLTIFTNYAKLPSIKSRFTATAIHDLTYIKYPELMEKDNLPHLLRIVKRSITDSDIIITVSEAVKKEIIEHFDVSATKILSLPIPPDEAFLIKNNAEVHKKYHIPTKKYIFFISTIEPRKNVPFLINAYTKLPKEITDEYSLILSGGLGWKSEQSIDAIAKARAQGLNVVHTGYIDEADKSALYQQASLFVFPSIYEGFGMPILEAAASKVPIIASDIPVLREAAGDGAQFFALDNNTSLIRSMEDVLTNPRLQQKLITAASAHLASFSWQENAEKIINKVTELEQSR